MEGWFLRALSLGTLVATSLVSGFAAHAAPDCPPLAGLPAYVAASPEAEQRSFDGTEFSVHRGGNVDTVEVRGRSCRQAYSLKEGADALSDLEIQSSYREQLQKLGAQLLFTDVRDTVAKLEKGGEETWIKVYSQETDIDVVTVVKQALKLTLTPPAGPDYRLLGHMPNYAAGTPEKKAFDELGFAVRGEEEVTETPAQGAKYVVAYRLKPGAEAASDAEIQENYRAALGLLGAALLYTDPRTTVGRLEQNGQTIWVRVYSQDGEIEVRAIEEKPFAAPALQAAALKSALEKEGRVALYVGFDGAKAALKPEAARTVAEVVKLLKENPTLKLSIEGHTDDVGPRPANEKLSRDRAAAVLEAIAAGGIARARLSSAGHGPAKPLADNGTSEGRAKNRRVELVKG
jgi:outer membrane protein OmpA-like peptidoglycan-associated protein